MKKVTNKELDSWIAQDTAVSVTDKIIMYSDTSNGEEELDYIIMRLKTLYAAGGAVSEIHIVDSKDLNYLPSHITRLSHFGDEDNSRHYKALLRGDNINDKVFDENCLFTLWINDGYLKIDIEDNLKDLVYSHYSKEKFKEAATIAAFNSDCLMSYDKKQHDLAIVDYDGNWTFEYGDK